VRLLEAAPVGVLPAGEFGRGRGREVPLGHFAEQGFGQSQQRGLVDLAAGSDDQPRGRIFAGNPPQ
jgi:hypothetical protein